MSINTMLAPGSKQAREDWGCKCQEIDRSGDIFWRRPFVIRHTCPIHMLRVKLGAKPLWVWSYPDHVPSSVIAFDWVHGLTAEEVVHANFLQGVTHG